MKLSQALRKIFCCGDSNAVAPAPIAQSGDLGVKKVRAVSRGTIVSATTGEDLPNIFGRPQTAAVKGDLPVIRGALVGIAEEEESTAFEAYRAPAPIASHEKPDASKFSGFRSVPVKFTNTINVKVSKQIQTVAEEPKVVQEQAVQTPVLDIRTESRAKSRASIAPSVNGDIVFERPQSNGSGEVTYKKARPAWNSSTNTNTVRLKNGIVIHGSAIGLKNKSVPKQLAEEAVVAQNARQKRVRIVAPTLEVVGNKIKES